MFNALFHTLPTVCCSRGPNNRTFPRFQDVMSWQHSVAKYYMWAWHQLAYVIGWLSIWTPVKRERLGHLELPIGSITTCAVQRK